MKGNLMAVPIQLSKSMQFEASHHEMNSSISSWHFKMNGAKATFYKGFDKYSLYVILAEMSKYAH